MAKFAATSGPLPVRVTDHVFAHIRENTLGTGDSLPSEVRTAAELGVSRSIVREAFRSLEMAGVIDKGNGRSPKVGAVNGDFLGQLLLHALSTRQMSADDVLDVRTALEVRSAELAAHRRTAADMQHLRAAVLGMKRSANAPDEFVEHDLSFHSVLNRVAGNVLLEVMGSAIHDCMRETIRAGLLSRRKRSEILEVLATHTRIADAVEARDATAAGKLMRRHFVEARRAFRRVALRG